MGNTKAGGWKEPGPQTEVSDRQTTSSGTGTVTGTQTDNTHK